MNVRCLIVDDEPVARQLLRSFIEELDWMSYEGEAEDGAGALEAIDSLEPDLVFLDVRLPDLSGVDVLERMTHRPAVAFTTAYDEYAIRALQLGAVDYLVKPFGRLRFLETASRIRERLQIGVTGPDETERVRNMLRGAPALRRMYVRRSTEIIPVDLASVERIESADDYVMLHVRGQRHPAHLSMSDLQRMLDAERFVRIHRCHIVNLDYVAAFRDFDARRFVVVMRDGTKLVASRAGTRVLRNLVT